MLAVEIALHSFVLVLLPLTIWSLIAGSPPPALPPLSKYYRAEKYLNLAGNLFLLTVCASSATRLASHFGLIGADDRVEMIVSIPFLMFLLVYAGFWVSAYVKVRRAERSGDAPGAP